MCHVMIAYWLLMWLVIIPSIISWFLGYSLWNNMVWIMEPIPFVIHMAKRSCSTCGGKGWYWNAHFPQKKETCSSCNGTGEG